MTVDLEKARKIVGAMSPTPWIVLEDRYGQIDVIRNPNHPMHEEGVIELWGMTSETATPDAIGISYMRSEFPNALDEIERLRARDRQAAAAIVAMAEGAKQHVLKTHTIMKNVFDEADSLAGYCEELENIVITKDARIKELEDVHKRSGAKYAKIIDELRSSVYANTPGLKKQWDEILNAPANGKIGPDAKPREGLYGKYRVEKADGSPVDPNADYFILRLDADPVAWSAIREYARMTPNRKLSNDLLARVAKYDPCDSIREPDEPRSWQITEERKAVILHCKRMLTFLKEDDAPCYDVEKITKDESVLVAMLEEADHDKP